MQIKLYYPSFSLRQLPPMLYLSLGALLGVVLTAYVLHSRFSQQNTQLIGDYAQAMAGMAATDAADSVLNHDLVSLHAMLQALTVQPRVMMAVVHDVEGHLLVQSGELDFGVKHASYASTIALHDSVAGQLTVYVQSGFAGDEAVNWVFYGMAVLLCFLAGLSLFESRGQAWQMKTMDINLGLAGKSKEQVASAQADLTCSGGASQASDAADGRSSVPDGESMDLHDDEVDFVSTLDLSPGLQFAQCDLILLLANCKSLKKQLNRTKFEHLFKGFQDQLSQVLMLYGGVLVVDEAMEEEGVFCVRFSSLDGQSEATFRAICAAYLCRTLAKDGSLYFDVIAYVCDAEADVKMDLKAKGIFIVGEPCLEGVKDKIIVKEHDNGTMQLEGFENSMSALIDKQLEQLRETPV